MAPDSLQLQSRKRRPIKDANDNLTEEIEEDELFSEKIDNNPENAGVVQEKNLLNGQFGFNAFVKLLICAVAGILDGLAMEKGRVFEPLVIRHQFEFRSFVMMKMFLSAVSSGLLCMALMSILPFTTQRFQLARNSFIERFQLKGYLSAALGGAMLGSGMMLAGARFDGVINRRYFTLAIPFGLALIPIIGILDFAIPWRSELAFTSENGNIFNSRAWAPYYAGALIGLLQVPMVLFVNENLGGSSSYCTMTACTISEDMLKKLSPYLYKMRTGFKNWGMVSTLRISIQSHVPCGHGLSGMGNLLMLSFAAIPAMFVGGSLTAIYMHITNMI
ncbi:uncharacterized protein LOC117106276 [Anneissia japonica]|uniref:uncharacterized protein LOC117106276 n=1 Tax=Anneissia japonica TaxID=1529436 RepID=UPI0014259304|nr:uncharacterized protein LOC117106276 [Anneissia japonica]